MEPINKCTDCGEFLQVHQSSTECIACIGAGLEPLRLNDMVWGTNIGNGCDLDAEIATALAIPHRSSSRGHGPDETQGRYEVTLPRYTMEQLMDLIQFVRDHQAVHQNIMAVPAEPFSGGTNHTAMLSSHRWPTTYQTRDDETARMGNTLEQVGRRLWQLVRQLDHREEDATIRPGEEEMESPCRCACCELDALSDSDLWDESNWTSEDDEGFYGLGAGVENQDIEMDDNEEAVSGADEVKHVNDGPI